MNGVSFITFSLFRTPSGLEDVSKYPALFAGLLASGAWSLDDLKKLAGLNFMRVLREVERVSEFSFEKWRKLINFGGSGSEKERERESEGLN